MKALDVALEIQRRTATIQIANGFKTNIGVSGFYGRAKAVNDDEIPCHILIEGPDMPVDQPARVPSVLNKQRFVIGGWDLCDINQPNVKGQAIVADLKKAIWQDDLLGLKVQGVRRVTYIGKDITPRVAGASVVAAYVEFDVEYVEELASQ